VSGLKIKRLGWALGFESSRRWINGVLAERTGSNYTVKGYVFALWDFCQFAGLNPDELVDLARRDRSRVEDMVREWVVKRQKERKLKRSSIAYSYVAPIKSFFRYNDVRLRVKQPKSDAVPLSPHSLEEIRELLSVANVRERALILLLKDSGLSREDVVKLKYGDIRREFEAGKEFIHIRMLRGKGKIAYDTFIGRNAVEALRAYLNFRRNRGEKITDDSPLIASRGGKPLTPKGISTLFLRLTKKSGIETSAHRLRKTFESYLGLSAPSILVKYWMGHSLGVEKSYFLPPIEKQREEYIKAYRQIDISEKELSEVERRKQQILDMVRLLIPEKFETVKTVLMKVKSARELDSKIENIMAVIRREREGFEAPMVKIKRKKEVEEDSEDCQKIVCEDELEGYLKRGWKVQAVLPTGKIVIEK